MTDETKIVLEEMAVKLDEKAKIAGEGEAHGREHGIHDMVSQGKGERKSYADAAATLRARAKA